MVVCKVLLCSWLQLSGVTIYLLGKCVECGRYFAHIPRKINPSTHNFEFYYKQSDSRVRQLIVWVGDERDIKECPICRGTQISFRTHEQAQKLCKLRHSFNTFPLH